ncbi:MAG: hypothetical protein WA172_21715 [Terriglobales bacterium]|jgi:hypothetical protein
MSEPSLVIVLLEDEHHKRFVYKYLNNRGLKPHAIRILTSPAGAGSAENWVRRTFVNEVTNYRRRRVKAATALILVIDTDIHAVQDRLTQLDQALKDGRREPVDVERDQIARLVPKRNVEAWILCLNARVVDEKTAKSLKEALIQCRQEA